MKKEYIIPVVNAILISKEDIITTSSSNGGSGGGIILPDDEWDVDPQNDAYVE